MRALLLTLFFLCAVIASSESHQAIAAATNSKKPLVVIRFNQAEIYFREPMYEAIDAALAIKPESQFTVTTVIPRVYKKSLQDEWQHIATNNQHVIIQAIRSHGVNPHHIHARTAIDPKVENLEAHIFVE